MMRTMRTMRTVIGRSIEWRKGGVRRLAVGLGSYLKVGKGYCITEVLSDEDSAWLASHTEKEEAA